ncbi:histidinol-phosphate transaminase [Xanthomarina spongicola]|uniref:Histidinol-phosphate aminotransferase n=1 Tax=Xanthomarina spongicola TaxID=570520 RepID=A0A316DQ76_9FLAO|nr:histidinol-phosphate transaminase [Xanthomarina spongicola]PWK19936.1 histidinol-phosphate aminotransferase [Xanthomarina spongicola]
MKILELVRNNVKELKPYASARDEYQDGLNNKLFLDANENPFDNGVNRYPDPQQSQVKSELSKIKNLSTNNMLLGNGSDEILDLIFRAFCEPNKDRVITLPPTYGMYQVLANINAVEVVEVPLSNTFQPRIDKILEVTNAKILFLCSPNNPSGNCFAVSDVEKLLKNFQGIVVLDEAYIDFSEQKSWLNKLDEFPNLIITQTFSKAYGLAGIRLGIGYASTEIISVLNKIKPPYNVNSLTQQSVLDRLKNRKEVAFEIQQIKAERENLIIELQAISFISKIYHSDANFILVKVDDANFRYQQFIEKGIVIRNRTNQLGCKNCLRLTLGTKAENTRLINTLKAIQ